MNTPFNAPGHYPESAALVTYAQESLAERYADKHADEAVSVGGLVVRWVAA